MHIYLIYIYKKPNYVSMKMQKLNFMYVISAHQKGPITSYFNVCFPCHAKGNHKRHIKHMTADDT